MSTLVQVCAVDPGVGTACPSDSLAWLDLSAVVAPADLGIDAAGVAAAFGWGFAAVVLLWFFGYVVGVSLAMIRKA